MYDTDGIRRYHEYHLFQACITVPIVPLQSESDHNVPSCKRSLSIGQKLPSTALFMTINIFPQHVRQHQSDKQEVV